MANARRSTGPSLNHLSHGFTGSTVFLELESSEEFEGLLFKSER